MCSTADDKYQNNCAVMKQKLLERKYDQDNLNKQKEKVDLVELRKRNNKK